MCLFIVRADYKYSLEKLFSAKSKFKQLNVDPTLTRLTTLQTYLNTLYERGEIIEDQKNEMRHIAAQIGRDHDGLPKIHKEYTNNLNSVQLLTC